MRWTIKQGDILDEPADVLICSANVFLNLSGGVGGEILRRHGPAMQEELHGLLARSGRQFVERGEVVVVPACGTGYKTVIHAVAVDGFYESSAEVVEAVVRKALAAAAGMGARRVALTALATGFGRLPMEEFAKGVKAVMGVEYAPVEDVVICVGRAEQVEVLRASLAAVDCA